MAASSRLSSLKTALESELGSQHLTFRLIPEVCLVISVWSPSFLSFPLFHALIDSKMCGWVMAFNGYVVQKELFSSDFVQRYLKPDQYQLCQGLSEVDKNLALSEGRVLIERVGDDVITRSQYCSYLVAKDQLQCAACGCKEEADEELVPISLQPHNDLLVGDVERFDAGFTMVAKQEEVGSTNDSEKMVTRSQGKIKIEEESENWMDEQEESLLFDIEQIDEKENIHEPELEVVDEEETWLEESSKVKDTTEKNTDKRRKPRKMELFEESNDKERTVDNSKSLICEVCGAAFRSNNGRRKHWAVAHSNEEKRKCSLCGFEYRNAATYRRHLQRHHQPYKPFSCRLCDYKAKLKHMLKDHLTGKHKIPLEECHKHIEEDTSFNLEKAIEENRGLHFANKRGSLEKKTTIDVNQCDRCGKIYETTHKLKMHISYVHLKPAKYNRAARARGRVRIPCYICGAMITRHNMRKHWQSHNSNNVYGCSLCPFETKTTTCVRRHVIEVHKKTKQWQDFVRKIGEHDFAKVHQDKAHLKPPDRRKSRYNANKDAQECNQSNSSESDSARESANLETNVPTVPIMPN